MIEVFILDEDRNKIHIIDNYKSLIWVNRYDELGDCELMIDASIHNLNMFKNGVYLSRDDDDMLCKIEKIGLNTDIENGNYLIVTGVDVKKILGQRIIWKQTNFNGLVEDYIRKLINDNVINPTMNERKINDFVLDDKNNYIEKIREQVTYDNLNSKIQETIKKYNWGYKVYLNNQRKFVFKLYKGEDRTLSVIFSNDYENLASSNYTEDKSNIANVALTAGEGEGAERITNVTGGGTGLDRYELYVDAKSLSKKVEYNDLISAYPDGVEVTIGGVTYYQVEGVNIATLIREDDKVNCSLTDLIYTGMLESKGVETLAQHKPIKYFDGSVETSINFIYKKDYFLGDIVTVENEYNISANARIVEVLEVNDDEGYRVEPKFEYLEDTVEPVDTAAYILTENENILLTENNQPLVLEEYEPLMRISTSNISALATEIESRKISELSEVESLADGCCMPVVSFGETKKVTFQTIKNQLKAEIPQTEVSVGTTTTGEPGTSVSVVNSGTPIAPILDFTIPRGDVGPRGLQGEVGPKGDQGPKGDTGESGPQGPAGPQGPQGPAGTGGTIIEIGSNSNGNWIKYDNGYMECFKSVSVSNKATSKQYFGDMFGAAQSIGATPQTFTDVWDVKSSCTNSNTTYWTVGSITGNSNSSFGSVQILRTLIPTNTTGGKNVSGTIYVKMTGKWK